MSQLTTQPVLEHAAEPTLKLLHIIGQNTIYLMGVSFILGCLFTILLLLLLDFMRRHHERKDG